MWMWKEGEVGLLGGQLGSHVIKTNNIVSGALARGWPSRFVMGIRIRSTFLLLTCVTMERYIRMVILGRHIR